MMDMLADRISVDRPVLNKTGLTGAYNIKLEAPEFRIRDGIEPNDISVFGAVQDQLGLTLVDDKAMIEILMVDRIEKPSANSHLARSAGWWKRGRRDTFPAVCVPGQKRYRILR